MNDLVVIVYDDPHRAAEVMTELQRISSEKHLDLDNTAIATKDAQGKVRLQQTSDLTVRGAVGGTIVGTLIGLLFAAPWLGLAVGAASGAIGGHFTDIGVDDKFVKAVGERLKNDSSALFVLVPAGDPEHVIDSISRLGGEVHRVTLPEDIQAKVEKVLSRAQMP